MGTQGARGHVLCHPWRLAGRQHHVLRAYPADRGALGFQGLREHQHRPGKEGKQGIVRCQHSESIPASAPAWGVKPNPATFTAVPHKLGTVPDTPRLAPTLAPSLPGAPLAPRGPWGPGGPWTPRSPGNPLSPWGGEAGEGPRPSGGFGALWGAESSGGHRGVQLTLAPAGPGAPASPGTPWAGGRG